MSKLRKCLRPENDGHSILTVSMQADAALWSGDSGRGQVTGCNLLHYHIAARSRGRFISEADFHW
jgi:hypothetical protein